MAENVDTLQKIAKIVVREAKTGKLIEQTVVDHPVTSPPLTEEEREAREAEGIVTLDSEDARLDLARRYRELLAKQNTIKAEMEDIKLLLKEDAAQNGTREFHYNGHKIISINEKHNRSTNMNLLFKDFPAAYKAAVSESVSTSINFSEIKE